MVQRSEHPSTSVLASWRRHEARPLSSLPRRWRGPSMRPFRLHFYIVASSCSPACASTPSPSRKASIDDLGQWHCCDLFFSDLRPWLFPGRDRRSIALDHARKRLRPSPRWSAARRQPRRRLLEPSDRLGARLERAGRHRFLPKRDLQVSETSMIGASRSFIFKTIDQWSIPELDSCSARFETQYFRPDERPSPGSTRNTSSRMSVPQPSSKRGAVALATEQRFGTTPVKFLFCPVGVRT